MSIDTVKAAVEKACEGSASEVVGDVTMHIRAVYDHGSCGTRIYLGYDPEGNIYTDRITEMDGWNTTATSPQLVKWPLPVKGEGIGPFEDFQFTVDDTELRVIYLGTGKDWTLNVLLLEWSEDSCCWKEVEMPEIYYRYADDPERASKLHLAAREEILRWRESP